MKLSDARGAYDAYSGKASDITRQLCFAGIAVIWLFRTGENSGGILFSNSLLWPLGGYVLGLALDLLQYLAGSLAWSIFHRHKEKTGRGPDDVFKAPPWINYPTIVMFYGKSILVLISSAMLIRYIYLALGD